MVCNKIPLLSTTAIRKRNVAHICHDMYRRVVAANLEVHQAATPRL